MEGYSKLVAWEVFNFMSIEYAKVSFDETNIINIKGYNDSGKSALIRALDVLFFNVKPSSQVHFIKDGCDYFRVICYFSDGVLILRDKYVNGQGLYEMYKDGKLLFSTKSGNELTRINAVPEAIAKYLGLIVSDDWNVNSRSCFEKQLLVQTKGSENSRALNEILRAEEIAQAGELINTDKNKINARISAVSAELEVYKKQTRESNGVSSEMISALKAHDNNLNNAEERLQSINRVGSLVSEVAAIPSIPEVNSIDVAQLKHLYQLRKVTTELNSIPSIPEVKLLDVSRLKLLASIKESLLSADKIEIPPQIKGIDTEQINALLAIRQCVNELAVVGDAIKECDSLADGVKQQLVSYSEKLKQCGERFVECQNCGTLVVVPK